MYTSPSRWLPASAGLILAIAIGCQTAPPQKSAPGNLPGQMPLSQEPRVTATTYLAHGHLLERQGQFERALVQYQKALRMQPDFVTVRNRVGITLNKLGRHAEATEQFRQALRNQPETAFLCNNLGFSLYLEGRYAEAETVMKQTLALKSDYGRAHMNYALVLAKLGRFDAAFEELNRACDGPDACYNMGILLTEAQRYADAAHYLEQALTLRPTYEAARTQLREVSRLAAESEAYQAAHKLASDQPGTAEAVPQIAPPNAAPAENDQPSVVAELPEDETAAPEPSAERFDTTMPAEQASPAVVPQVAAPEVEKNSTGSEQILAAPESPAQPESESMRRWEQTTEAQAPEPQPLAEAQPCDETDPDTVAILWGGDEAWLERMADSGDWSWLQTLTLDADWPRETAPAALVEDWDSNSRPEPRSRTWEFAQESAIDPERLAAMIDETVWAWRQGYTDEFDRLWCQLGYYVFPETAPVGPELSPGWLVDQRDFETRRDTGWAK